MKQEKTLHQYVSFSDAIIHKLKFFVKIHIVLKCAFYYSCVFNKYYFCVKQDCLQI